MEVLPISHNIPLHEVSYPCSPLSFTITTSVFFNYVLPLA